MSSSISVDFLKSALSDILRNDPTIKEQIPNFIDLWRDSTDVNEERDELVHYARWLLREFPFIRAAREILNITDERAVVSDEMRMKKFKSMYVRENETWRNYLSRNIAFQTLGYRHVYMKLLSKLCVQMKMRCRVQTTSLSENIEVHARDTKNVREAVDSSCHDRCVFIIDKDTPIESMKILHALDIVKFSFVKDVRHNSNRATTNAMARNRTVYVDAALLFNDDIDVSGTSVPATLLSLDMNGHEVDLEAFLGSDKSISRLVDKFEKICKIAYRAGYVTTWCCNSKLKCYAQRQLAIVLFNVLHFATNLATYCRVPTSLRGTFVQATHALVYELFYKGSIDSSCDYFRKYSHMIRSEDYERSAFKRGVPKWMDMGRPICSMNCLGWANTIERMKAGMSNGVLLAHEKDETIEAQALSQFHDDSTLRYKDPMFGLMNESVKQYFSDTIDCLETPITRTVPFEKWCELVHCCRLLKIDRICFKKI
ncbi:hypothetical protein QAD02_001434 [Eretmocerus hayati]|uniref:Uncharacterized protein n=1 Tax=Eretmocerus hayati TaxID=131215 RepID=A0ACC2NG89_9HYME|nr:hypothetical protein QAD02_001434 [Eretmocerus hayati]